MATDLWPYSKRNAGIVTDLEHEALWGGMPDGILPGASNALLPAIAGSSWTVQPGKILISGHVLNLTTVVTDPLPAAGSQTMRNVWVAFIDRSTDPWTYGVRVHPGTPGAGRPSLSQSATGLYEVPLRAFDRASNGANTLLTDERTFLRLGVWTDLSLAAGYTAYDDTPQYRVSNAGKRVDFRGTIRRSVGGNINAANGIVVMTVPGVCRPAAAIERFTGQAQAGGVCTVEIVNAGQMTVRTPDDSFWVGINGTIWRD